MGEGVLLAVLAVACFSKYSDWFKRNDKCHAIPHLNDHFGVFCEREIYLKLCICELLKSIRYE